MSYREGTGEPAPRSPRAPPTPSDDATIAFSAAVTEELGVVLNAYLASPHPDDAALRHAVDRLCTEAHERDLGPERMVVAVKSVWHDLKLDNAMDEGRKQLAFDRILTTCLDAYYDARTMGARDDGMTATGEWHE